MPLTVTLRLTHFALLTLARIVWLWKPPLAPTADALLAVDRMARMFVGGEYHIPDTMLLLTSHSAVILALAALACAGLLVSILQRSKQNAEIVVLELMIASIAGYFLLLAVADSLPVSGADAHRHSYILQMCAEMLRIAFFIFSGHFLALTHKQTVNEGAPLDAPITVLGQFRETDLAKIWIAFAYTGGVSAIALHLIALRDKLHTYSNWQMAGPQLPHSAGWGFFYGFSVGILLTIQLQILSNIYSQVPDEERQNSRLARWHLASVGKPPRGGYVIGLMLTQRPRESRLAGPLYKPDEFKAFLVLMIGTIAGVVLFAMEHRARLLGADALALWTLGTEIFPIFIWIPLVYYKTRFLFFDAVVKRGILGLTLIGSCSLLVTLVPEDLSKVLVWAIAFSLATVWSAVRGRMNRVVDRYLFHRPDYNVLQPEIGESLRSFDEAPAAIAYVTGKLRDALHATFVNYVESLPTENEAVSIPVTNGRRTLGHLLFGERPNQAPYQSEDLQFLSAIAALFAATLDHIEHAHRERELRELAVRAELKALKAQINPHFFFNALNTVADLTQSNPEAAEKTILNLARIFQFALEASKQETVPLGREVAFVRSYLEIEKARFEEKLDYWIDVPEEIADLPIPPMLVQPLVENAVRHGISPKPTPGQVIVTARLREDRLWISVEDDGVGFEPSPLHQGAGQGIGLGNVAERVERLAGAGHWQVESASGRGTLVRFDLEVVRCAC
jgi:signal transduction histidine kinase